MNFSCALRVRTAAVARSLYWDSDTFVLLSSSLEARVEVGVVRSGKSQDSGNLRPDFFVGRSQTQFLRVGEQSGFVFDLSGQDLHCDLRVLGDLALGAAGLLYVLAQALAVIPHTVLLVAYLDSGGTGPVAVVQPVRSEAVGNQAESDDYDERLRPLWRRTGGCDREFGDRAHLVPAPRPQWARGSGGGA